MRLFISWSGDQSKAVAAELQQWLQEIIQAVEPWMSTDIDKGRKWIDELNERLELSKVGILCLTRSALDSPWLHYEAGALAKTKDALVCSVLFGIEPEDVRYPLAQFQQTVFDKEDIRRLVQSINKAVARDGGRSLPEPVLDRLFERNWPSLELALKDVLEIEDESDSSLEFEREFEPPKEELDMMEEMMGVVLLSRPSAGWTIQDLVPAVFRALSPDAKSPPAHMLAMLAGQFEKKNLTKMIRMGLLEEANGKYFLTDSGQLHFESIAERVKSFQQRGSASGGA